MPIPQTYFYHSSVRNLTAAFGSLFTNMLIKRVDTNNQVVTTIRVPIAYGPGDKTIKMLQQQDTLRTEGGVDIKISLPRLSFFLSNLTYDATRKLPTLNSVKCQNGDGDSVIQQFVPIPYDFEFTLMAFVKNIDDGLQIIEQILPHFPPSYTITTNDIPSLNIKRDVPITLTSVSQDDVYEGAVEEDRILQWTLTFMAKGYIYPPISSDVAKVIKTTYVNVFEGEFGSSDRLFGMVLEVDPLTAEYTDDWTIKYTTFVGATGAPGATGASGATGV